MLHPPYTVPQRLLEVLSLRRDQQSFCICLLEGLLQAQCLQRVQSHCKTTET